MKARIAVEIDQNTLDSELLKVIDGRIKHLLRNDEYIVKKIEERINEQVDKKVNWIIDSYFPASKSSYNDTRKDQMVNLVIEGIIKRCNIDRGQLSNIVVGEVKKQVAGLILELATAQRNSGEKFVDQVTEGANEHNENLKEKL